MKKKSMSVVNIGSVSLLMVFIVLCLVTFAMLSLSSAIRNYHFSEKMAAHTTEYYQASNGATKKLREIDSILQASYKAAVLEELDYYSQVKESLAELDWLETDFNGPVKSLSYRTEMNDNQALQVTLMLNPPEETESGFCRITVWKEISIVQWEGSDSLHLMEDLSE